MLPGSIGTNSPISATPGQHPPNVFPIPIPAVSSHKRDREEIARANRLMRIARLQTHPSPIVRSLRTISVPGIKLVVGHRHVHVGVRKRIPFVRSGGIEQFEIGIVGVPRRVSDLLPLVGDRPRFDACRGVGHYHLSGGRGLHVGRGDTEVLPDHGLEGVVALGVAEDVDADPFFGGEGHVGRTDGDVLADHRIGLRHHDGVLNGRAPCRAIVPVVEQQRHGASQRAGIGGGLRLRPRHHEHADVDGEGRDGKEPEKAHRDEYKNHASFVVTERF